jgi:hypothetical protein
MALAKSQRSLKAWGKQKWRTRSGKPSTQGSKATGERYLPEKAIKALSASEYAATVAEKVATGQVEWEGKMADATVDSWKDEFALVVLLAPAILVFIPGMREYVKEGFEILATLPDWYQYLLYIAISASFGIKGVGQAAKMLKKK